MKGIAEHPGHYILIGDANGVIPISDVDWIPDPDPPAHGDPAYGTIVLSFVSPLPDDRFLLRISDALVDPVGNHLDGESNSRQPLEVPQFPTGDGVPGGNFLGRFTVDSRPEVGAWAGGSIFVDTNGNFSFDPDNLDFTNRDITYTLPGHFTSDDVFAGNFFLEGEERFVFTDEELRQIASSQEEQRGEEMVVLSDEENGEAGIKVTELFESRELGKAIGSLAKAGVDVHDFYESKKPVCRLIHGEEETDVYSLEELVETIRRLGRKGITVQRYKGLGEMNPEQLWETTMDPNKRVILKIVLEDAVAAQETFSTLMGMEVGPRKEFIEKSARWVTNLDI